MVYKSFDVKIYGQKVARKNAESKTIECDGFIIEIYGENKETPLEVFNTAVGYEILENSIEEAEQLVRDYIDTEKLEFAFMK